MADFAIAAVEVLCVRLLESLHEFAQGSGASLKEHVHMLCEVPNYVKLILPHF